MLSLAAAATFACLGQITYAGKGEVLQRPMIPDYGMVRQPWVQADLQLPLSSRKEINTNPMWTPAKLRQATRTGGTFADTVAIKFGSQYKNRLTQLALWYHDLHALTDPGVAKQVGLTKAESDKINAKFRAYYQWHADELARQEKLQRTETSKRLMPYIDPVQARIRVMKLRQEVRSILPAQAAAKFRAMKGKAPATITPFGWIGGAIQVHLDNTDRLIYSPRIHEELGFSMKQSRTMMEHQNEDPQVELRKLSGSQMNRYRQLELQYLGAVGIMRHDVADALAISPSTYDNLIVKLSDLQKSNGSWSGPEMRALAAKQKQLIFSALSRPQAAKYQTMLGPIVKEIAPAWMLSTGR